MTRFTLAVLLVAMFVLPAYAEDKPIKNCKEFAGDDPHHMRQRMACLQDGIEELERRLKGVTTLLDKFIFVNVEQSTGKRCLYKSGSNTSDAVALEKCDSVPPDNQYQQWRIEPLRK